MSAYIDTVGENKGTCYTFSNNRFHESFEYLNISVKIDKKRNYNIPKTKNKSPQQLAERFDSNVEGRRCRKRER